VQPFDRGLVTKGGASDLGLAIVAEIAGPHGAEVSPTDAHRCRAPTATERGVLITVRFPFNAP